MDFSVYRSKIRLLRSIGALLTAVAASGVTFGVLNLLSRLELLALTQVAAIVITAGVTVVVFFVSYLLMRMTGKKLAKKLDNDFSLSERVQTSLEFEGRREAIYELQRADTRTALSGVDTKKLGLKGMPVYVICAILGIALTVLSFFFKKEVPPEPVPDDPPFALSEIQEASLIELIEYVSTSEMESPYREQVADELSALLSGLKAASVMSQRDALLSSALRSVYDITDSSSFLLELSEELYAREPQPLKELAKAINYYSYASGEEWDAYSDGLTVFRISFIHADVLAESPDLTKMSEETRALLSSVVSGASIGITRSGIPTSDALTVVLKALFEGEETGLSALASSELGYEELQAALDTLVAALDSDIFDVILVNKTNTDTGEYAMKRLASIFSYTCPAFERPRLRDSSAADAGGGSDDEQGGGQGAIGSGTVFGSDDLVLDPNTDEYVEYGTIISRYYELVFGKLESDGYTEEEKAVMEKYFKILYGTAND